MNKDIKKIINGLISAAIIAVVGTVIYNGSAIAVLKSEDIHIKESLHRIETKLGTLPKGMKP